MYRKKTIAAAAALTVSLTGGGLAYAQTTAPTTSATTNATNAMPRPMPIMAMDYDYAKLLSSLHGARLETTFMAGMIVHHQTAISMAKIEVARGGHPVLKATARNIIAAQQHEIEQMTAWLKNWYNLTPQQAIAAAPADAASMIRMMRAHMKMMSAMLGETPAGNRTDRLFLQMMIPHHQMAILEAQPVQSGANHARLLAMTNTIITSQEQEVLQMLNWLSTWF